MTTPHKHAEIIKAWADGARVEVNEEACGWREVTNSPAWCSDREYRIKPAAPVIETKMTGKEFEAIWDLSDVTYKQGIHAVWAAYTRIANAAIARAIADGQVVPAPDITPSICAPMVVNGLAIERAKRDMAVALAAYNFAYTSFSHNSADDLKTRLAKLIATVE